ncbi:MAG: hypothetical protein R2820_15105 [Cyclobacteriaceae bacterium]|nr:hypothetical protein [Cyclobacteriaceae bacterium]
MKNKQKAVLNFLFALLLLFTGISTEAQTPDRSLKKADSLYNQKQYTQSLEIYGDLLSKGLYSQSILLKMAFIHEGLGNISESLYYLNLYYLASNDETALVKMNEMADKHHLIGYKTTQTRQAFSLLREYHSTITGLLSGIAALIFGLMIYNRKREKSTMPLAIMMLFMLAIIFSHINYSLDPHLGIVHRNSTYLMSGPSAGASVIGILNEGHLLDLEDKKDVWVHVKWMNEDAYIREDQILRIEL